MQNGGSAICTEKKQDLFQVGHVIDIIARANVIYCFVDEEFIMTVSKEGHDDMNVASSTGKVKRGVSVFVFLVD